jgi:hypothetical protein
VLAEAMDQAHLTEAMDAVMRRLGGTARHWRTDRLATVIVPGSAEVQATFARSPSTTGRSSFRARHGGGTARVRSSAA